MWITSPRKLAFVSIAAIMLLPPIAAACGEPEVAPQDQDATADEPKGARSGVAAVDTSTQSQSPDTGQAAADEAQEPPVSLDDIKAEFGVLYLPSYLPPA